MYFRRMQRIRRTAHQRRVHEAQRQVQAAAERDRVREEFEGAAAERDRLAGALEALRAVIHSHVR